MNMQYYRGTTEQLQQIKALALRSWEQYKTDLSDDNWEKLHANLSDQYMYANLIAHSACFVCATETDNVIGMAFLVPNGNPTDIYDSGWSYIRFLTVDPDFGGQGIGRKLTELCIEEARNNKETTIALHTSEMMDKARHIYEELGFKIDKEIEPRLGKRYWLYKMELS
jgi:ribosomal protein S18 acetylase RimI-like enzyme